MSNKTGGLSSHPLSTNRSNQPSLMVTLLNFLSAAETKSVKPKIIHQFKLGLLNIMKIFQCNSVPGNFDEMKFIFTTLFFIITQIKMTF